MKIYRIAQNLNLKTNPEAVFAAYRVLEHQEMNEAQGWDEWLHYLELEKEGIPDWMKEDMGIVATIYGQGGWNRYHVLDDGAITFSAMHSNKEGIEKAKEVGFLID